MEHSFIYVRHLGPEMPRRMPAERIPLGVPGDYKPNVAVMPDGELLLTAFQTKSFKVREPVFTRRS